MKEIFLVYSVLGMKVKNTNFKKKLYSHLPTMHSQQIMMQEKPILNVKLLQKFVINLLAELAGHLLLLKL
jgi:hypothetical protein